MLKKRVISAAVLLPIVLVLFVIGSWPYRILIVVVTLLAGFEITRMFRRREYGVSFPLISMVILVWEVDAVWPGHAWLLSGVAIASLIVTLVELIRVRARPQRHDPTEQWALTLAGGTYLGIGGVHLMHLRALPDGLWWTLTACAVVWISDSAAYFVGKRWGRHKMAPGISPGKSWEGYAAQVVSGLASGLFLSWLWPIIVGVEIVLTPVSGLVLGGVISVLCPAGDFLVSMMKREVGVKDTGKLIPGHGGILDRLDSILWAGILGHLLAQLFV
ncbi:MAG: phosphatidate cytidylyltransferase [Anaerolineae bacterium]